MGDADLDEIRRARLQQLQQQGGEGGQGGSDEQQRRQEAESNARASILAQILSPEAADRLNRIRLVKESRATDVENRLIMLARSNQLRQRVDEEQLKQILAAMAEQSSGAGQGQSGGDANANYRYARRKGWDDEDDDLLEGLDD